MKCTNKGARFEGLQKVLKIILLNDLEEGVIKMNLFDS
jgi:hypothetical protein